VHKTVSVVGFSSAAFAADADPTALAESTAPTLRGPLPRSCAATRVWGLTAAEVGAEAKVETRSRIASS
jgi:hypothetical protein